MIYHPSKCHDLPVKQAQIEPKKAKEELKPFKTNFGTGQRALFALHDPGTALGFVSVLDFLGFCLLEHRRNGQNRIKTIFDHFRNKHAR